MRTFVAAVILLLSLHAQAQFLPTTLQTLDTPYMGFSRIGTSNYLAALRTGTLDIREIVPGSFGIRRMSVSIPSASFISKMEQAGSYVYVLTDSLRPVNLANPLSPVAAPPVALPGYPMTVGHWQHFLYVTSSRGNCYIYNITNPMAPMLIDSVPAPITEMRFRGDTLYAVKQGPNRIYHIPLSATPPYLAPTDSVEMPGGFSLSIDIYGTQLIAKTFDSLYRFRLSSPGLTLLSKEIMPDYPNNGLLVARDTNILGYARYNLFFVSGASAGNSFADSAEILTDGNYYVASGRLDDNLYFTNTTHSYLVGFNGSTSKVPVVNMLAATAIPNPAQNSIKVSIAKPGNYTISVSATDGTQKMKVTGNEVQDINLSSLAPGIYMLLIYDSHMQLTGYKKIVKL